MKRRKPDTIERFRVTPENTSIEALSPLEVEALFARSDDKIHALLRRCVLAVLSSGTETDDVKLLFEKYADFDLQIIKTASDVEMELCHAPKSAFVTYRYSGSAENSEAHKIIEGVRQNIFAVLRDLVFIQTEIERTRKYDLESPAGITDAVFLILRNAGIFRKTGRHKIVTCWGGHAISGKEYRYTKLVGYQCGLRFMDVITGCGPGAMKGPMKGAAVAHYKQRYSEGRYIGITEPGIIASEAPNPIVNPLVILPDIEKRLEAFVRLGHGVIMFPGGAGTAEELMYILGLLSHPRNRGIPFPLVLTAPKSSADYVRHLDAFVRSTLGPEAADKYEIIIDDPERVAQTMNRGLLEVKGAREKAGDSYFFNRSLFIPPEFQESFEPSHESVEGLVVKTSEQPHLFAASLRRFFSAVVWGNVKPGGIEAIETHGPLRIRGDAKVLTAIDNLVTSFVTSGRMRLEGRYKQVYRIA